MIGRCEEHGAYRSENNSCPICKREGKFLMNDHEVLTISRGMAGILRHFPERFGIELDKQGYANIEELASRIGRRNRYGWLRATHIIAVAETDERGRYQVKEDKVRATYGHTIDVDLSDLPDSDREEYFYPTSYEELGLIEERGLIPVNHSYIHLSGTKEKAMEAGKIHNPNPVIIKIDGKRAREEGISIKKGGKEVYLSKEIGASFLSVVE